MKLFKSIGSISILFFAASVVYGAGLQFLKNSPARYFTKQDWEMAKQATKELLEGHEAGDVINWKNPDSGNSGELKLMKIDESNGKVCKTLQVTNEAKASKSTTNPMFCQQPDGTWKAEASH